MIYKKNTTIQRSIWSIFEAKRMHVNTSQHDPTKRRLNSESNWNEKGIQYETFRSYNEINGEVTYEDNILTIENLYK